MIHKNILWILLFLLLLGLAVILGCQVAVRSAERGRTYNDVEGIPHREMGLLLGTNPLGRTGRPNQFFLRRIDATVDLYEAGKVDRIIISGARRGDAYDETAAMREELIKRGVPDSILTLDGEGFRTIASIKRAKEVFDADTLTIISQQFHNERALFMAQHNGMDAIAYNAANTTSRKWKIIMMGRECLSRVKAVFEVMGDKVRNE
jgi:SanA protein